MPSPMLGQPRVLLALTKSQAFAAVLILASDRLEAGPRAFHRHVVPASAGGAPTLPDALDCLILKTAVQPKETTEAKEFEGFTQTRPPTYRVNGNCLRTSFLSAFFVSFGHPAAGLSLTRCRLKAGLLASGVPASAGAWCDLRPY